jgi:hypothetical protein
MQRQPIQFDAMSASLSKRSATGAAVSHRTRKTTRDCSTSTVLDEVFANYSRVDAGSSINGSPAKLAPTDGRTMRELIEDISTQLEALDGQGRQLAWLLESVDSGRTV